MSKRESVKLAMKNKIKSLFTLNNKHRILELRLQILQKVIDRNKANRRLEIQPVDLEKRFTMNHNSMFRRSSEPPKEKQANLPLWMDNPSKVQLPFYFYPLANKSVTVDKTKGSNSKLVIASKTPAFVFQDFEIINKLV